MSRRSKAGLRAASGAVAERSLQEAVLRRWIDYLGLGEMRLFAKSVRDYSGISGLFAWRTDACFRWAVMRVPGVLHRHPQLARDSGFSHASQRAPVAVRGADGIEEHEFRSDVSGCGEGPQRRHEGRLAHIVRRRAVPAIVVHVA